MAGREGGGSGGIMCHRDECEWVQRREEGEKRRLKDENILQEPTQRGHGFRVQAPFLWYFTNTGYSSGCGRFRHSKIFLQRMGVSVKRYFGVSVFRDTCRHNLNTNKFMLVIIFSISHYYNKADLIGSI